MIRFFWFFLLHIPLFGVDFDCILIGSSPFSLFEALYQSQLGNKVLILEEAEECGGAWRGINVCGIMHADLGCHQIGRDMRLKTFLETYAGCTIVSMDRPDLPYDPAISPHGWYFSKGCYELIENLLQLIAQTDIVLLTKTKAENVFIDKAEKQATVETKENRYTTNKLIVTPMTRLQLAGCPQSSNRSKHYHLYLLIQDPTPPRFSYHGGVVSGVSRMMNLTHFANLIGTGRQLIVIQTHGEQLLSEGQAFLDGLKKHNLVDQGAYILESQTYIYESGSFQRGCIASLGAQGIIELMQTGHLQSLTSYIPKWEMALKPCH